MRCAIVLTPSLDEKAAEYTKIANEFYGEYQVGYLLSKESRPHITLAQFECFTFPELDKIWHQVCDKLKENNISSLSPPFSGTSFVNGIGVYDGTTWVELSVDRGAADSPIMKIHNIVVKILKESQYELLNANGNNYRPHLTLARIIVPETLKVCQKTRYNTPSPFKVEVGLLDDNFQYIHSLKELV